MILPLIEAKRLNRLPHALLFLGPNNIGKKEAARAFANTVLCSQSDNKGNPCQTCHACRLIQANSHPDLILIEPEEGARNIKIDQIRQVVDFVNESAMQGGYRVIIIHPANAMNTNAANALLKTLEEPSQNTLFILITHQKSDLPATITSRCQRIVFSGADNPLDDATLILRQDIYNGLHALSQRKTDPLQLAAQIQESELTTIFHLLFSWTRDLLRYKLTNSSTEIINSDYDKILIDVNQKISQQHILKFYDLIQQRYKTVTSSLNLNKQLLIEEIFTHWTDYVSC